MAAPLPGPRDLFGLRQLFRLRRDLLGWFEDLKRKHGDCVGMRLGPLRYVIFYHPDQIREVLISKARCFVFAPQVRRVLAQWNGRGLITTEGDEWKRQRRMLQTAFTHERLQDHASAIVDVASRTIECWLVRGPEAPLALPVETARVTLEIIARTMFDTDLSSHAAALGPCVETLSEIAVAEMGEPFLMPDWLPIPRVRRKLAAMRQLDDIVWGFVRARRAAGAAGSDLLSRLLSVVDDEGDGGRMSDTQVRDECTTLLLAGHDTTAAALIWAIHALAVHPAAMAPVAEEVNRVLAGRSATYADVAQLPRLERFVKETLRLWPPAIGAFPRQAVEDVEVGGFEVPRGSLVQIVSFVTHRDERWFPDPLRFDPDRFAPGRVELQPKLAYLPFGAGPRTCLGMGFAMSDLVLVLATFLSRATFAPVPGQGEPGLAPKMSLRPARELRVLVRRR